MSDLSETVRRELREQMTAMQQLVSGGRIEAATTACSHLRDRLDALQIDHPHSAELVDLRAAMLTNLADLAEQQGEWSRAEASWNEALPLLDRLARDYPQLPRYRQLLGQAYYRLGELHLLTYQPAKAEPAFRQALRAWESSNADAVSIGRAYAKLGESARQLRRADEALKAYRDAEKRFARQIELEEDVHEEWIHIRQQLGNIHTELKQPGQAIEYLEGAVAHERHHPLAPDRRCFLLSDLAQSYMLGGRPDGAEEAYHRAMLALGEPGSDWYDSGKMVGLLNRLGMLYLDTGRLRRADAIFQLADRRAAGHSERDLATPVHRISVLSNRLRVLRLLGREADQEELIGRLLTMLHQLKTRFPNESIVDYLEEKITPRLQEPTPPALPTVDQPMLTYRLAGPAPMRREHGPAPADLLEPLQRIRQLVDAKQYEQATSELAGVLSRNRSLPVQYDLIDLLRASGRETPALQAIDTLLQEHPKYADGWFLRGLLLGRFLDEQGGPAEPLDFPRHDAAIESFDHAILLEPEEAEFRLWKGRALFRLAHALLARNEWLRERCTKLRHGNTEALQLAEAEYHVTLGRARESFMMAAQLDPRDAEAPFALGALLIALEPDRREEARAAFQRALQLRPDFSAAREEFARLS